MAVEFKNINNTADSPSKNVSSTETVNNLNNNGSKSSATLNSGFVNMPTIDFPFNNVLQGKPVDTNLSKILNPDQLCALNDLHSNWCLSKEILLKIVDSFHVEMKKGLNSKGSTLLMVPSFVKNRPTGLEQGSFLALDFGGSNCRVCIVELLGKHSLKVKAQHSFKFTKMQMHEDGYFLFGYLSDFIGNFIEHYEKNNRTKLKRPINLGFTFSFPVDQTSIDSGTLVKWTKGFESSDVVGKNVVKIMQDCFDQRHIQVKVNALINDTVGTLLASAYSDPNTLMGLILGTGTNAAYYEKIQNIPKLLSNSANVNNNGIVDENEEMIINMEWGNFDSEKKVLPLTQYDEELDRLTWNPNQQIFEKTISGYYLGELFRIIIYRFAEKGLILNPKLAQCFSEMETLDAPMLSSIVGDNTQELKEVRRIIEEVIRINKTNNEYEKINITFADLVMINRIGTFVGYRAAQLAATGVSAVVLKRKDLLENSGHNSITVGIDGSVYEKFPNFDKWMRENLTLIVGEEISNRVLFEVAKDGSGVGAALTSMIASYNQ